MLINRIKKRENYRMSKQSGGNGNVIQYLRKILLSIKMKMLSMYYK